MDVPHRKRVKHFDLPGQVDALTCSCFRRLPLLTNDRWRGLLSEAIDRAAVRHRYRLIAFMFMPEHIHLLVWPEPEAAPIDALLRAIERPFSFRIKQLLEAAGSSLLFRLTVRQRPGVTTFRYWQEGPGYDRNIVEPRTLAAEIDYVHLNPVRRGLCTRADDWRWSSARHFAADGIAPSDPLLPMLRPLPDAWWSSGWS